MIEILSIDEASTLERASAALLAGSLVVIPTETVYGLAAAASRPEGVARLFAAKGRENAKAIAVLVADEAQARALIESPPPPRFGELAARFWPGPLTLVVRRAGHVDLALGGDETTIGVRCPADEWVRALARRVGPLATTSANLAGRPTPARASAIASVFDGSDVALVVDGGPRDGQPSTVYDLTADPPNLLRPGPIALDQG